MKRTPSPARYSINSVSRCCEMEVLGGITRLAAKVDAVFAALPDGSYVKPSRALYKHSMVVHKSRLVDCYTVRFEVLDVEAVRSALRAL